MIPFAFVSNAIAQAPTLPFKDLSVNKIYRNVNIAATDGFVQVNEMKNIDIDTIKGYTVEVKARVKSNTGRGLDIEGRDAGRKGFRLSVQKEGLINNTLPNTPKIINTDANDNDFHVFRFAVKNKNVHVYRDGNYISSTNYNFLTKEELLGNNNPGFESDDMSLWTLKSGQPGRTTTATEVRTGVAALKLTNSDQSEVANFVIKGIKPNTNYGLSFWAKGITMAGNMRFQVILGYYDNTSTFVQNSLNDYNEIKPGTTAWKMIGKPFTTGAADQVAIIRIMGWNSSNTLVIDDFSLTENEATPTVGSAIVANLITNGTFDTNADGWPLTGLSWPLGTAAWTSTNGGQLQIKETSWGNNYGGNYTVNAPVNPTKTYILSAKTSQLISGTYYNRIIDGASKSEVSYAASANLTAYLTNSTAPLTVGNNTTQVQLQFSTKTQHNGTPKVVMTLDDVVFQEYEASFPPFIAMGKMQGAGNADIDVEYFNYNLSGAFAPGVIDPNKLLWDSIEVAQDRLAAVVIGNIPGKYPQSAYDDYSTAINNAKNSALSVLTSEQLSQAMNNLTMAGTTFMGSVNKGQYYPQSIELTAFAPKISAGEATSTNLSIVMNDNQAVDYKFVNVSYSNLTPAVIEINDIGSMIGKVKGLGRMMVTVEFQDSLKRDTVDVEVVDFASMTFSLNKTMMLQSDSITFSFENKLSDENLFTTANKLVYSSNRNIIQVSDNGKLYAKGIGSAMIYGFARSGGIIKTAEYSVSVTNENTVLQTISESVLKFSPNPASDYIILSNPESIESIEILDLSGRCVMVYTSNTISANALLSVKSLKNGIYLIKANCNNILRTSKLIINR